MPLRTRIDDSNLKPPHRGLAKAFRRHACRCCIPRSPHAPFASHRDPRQSYRLPEHSLSARNRKAKATAQTNLRRSDSTTLGLVQFEVASGDDGVRDLVGLDIVDTESDRPIFNAIVTGKLTQLNSLNPPYTCAGPVLDLVNRFDVFQNHTALDRPRRTPVG